jgi:hypothetical protein
MKWKKVFVPGNASILLQHKNTDHAIEPLDGGTPPYGPIYPLSKRELQSPGGCPIPFILRRTAPFFVDYRGLNHVAVKNRYPVPLITKVLDRAAGAKYFTKIDVKDAYFRTPDKSGRAMSGWQFRS